MSVRRRKIAARIERSQANGAPYMETRNRMDRYLNWRQKRRVKTATTAEVPPEG